MTIHQSFLPHRDPDTSFAFYTDVLGFEVRLDVGTGEMRFITVGPPNQPDTSIVLQPPTADPSINGADVVQEQIDQDDGLRDCAVRDPAGN